MMVFIAAGLYYSDYVGEVCCIKKVLCVVVVKYGPLVGQHVIRSCFVCVGDKDFSMRKKIYANT